MRILSGVAIGLMLVGSAAAQQPAPASAAGVTLKPVTFQPPDSDRAFPGGEKAELVNANCVTCHSAGMVLSQPALSAQTWTEEVTKMRVVYKAPVAAEDVPAIVAYLAALKP